MLLDELTDVNNFAIKLTKNMIIALNYILLLYMCAANEFMFRGNEIAVILYYVTDDNQSVATLGSRFLIKNILYVYTVLHKYWNFIDTRDEERYYFR